MDHLGTQIAPFLTTIVIVGSFVFWLVELVDVLKRQFADSTTKLIWVLVVLIGQLFGALIYYFVGRPQGQHPTMHVR